MTLFNKFIISHGNIMEESSTMGVYKEDALASDGKGDVLASDGKGDVLASDGKGDALASDGEGDALASDGKGDALASDGKGNVVPLAIEYNDMEYFDDIWNKIEKHGCVYISGEFYKHFIYYWILRKMYMKMKIPKSKYITSNVFEFFKKLAIFDKNDKKLMLSIEMRIKIHPPHMVI